jgi:hypothetical protein
MLMGIFFFGTAALMFYAKLRDPRGLLINHLIELGSDGADIFWGILILVSLAMSALSLVGLIRSFGEKVYLTVDVHAVTGPRNWNSKRVVRIDYGSIRGVSQQRMRDQEFVVITANDGRKIKVGQTHFRKSDDWSEFLEELFARIAVAAPTRG